MVTTFSASTSEHLLTKQSKQNRYLAGGKVKPVESEKDMKRLFTETITRVYDYSKVTEADKHIKYMETRGWKAVIKDKDFNDAVYNNGQDEMSWSVEFVKVTDYK